MKKKELERRVHKLLAGMMCVTMVGTSVYVPAMAASQSPEEDVAIEEAGEVILESTEEDVSATAEDLNKVDTPANIEVSVAVNGDAAHGEGGEHKNYERWITPTEITVEQGETAGEVIRKILEDNQYTYTEAEGRITSLTGEQGSVLANGANGAASAWEFSIDGREVTANMDEYELQNDDEILLYFNDESDEDYRKPVDISLSLRGDTPHEEGKHENYVMWLEDAAYTVDEGKDVNLVLKETLEFYGYQAAHEPGEEYGVDSITTPDGVTISSDDWQFDSMWECAMIDGSWVPDTYKVQAGDEFLVYYTHNTEDSTDYCQRLIDSIGEVSIRSKNQIAKIRYIVNEAGFGNSVDDPRTKKLYDAEKRLEELEKTAFDVTFQIIGDDKHYEGKHKTYETWLKKAAYQANPGENALEVIRDILDDVLCLRGSEADPYSREPKKLPYKTGGKNITSITSEDGVKLSNGTNGPMSKWVCEVNGKALKKSMVSYKLKKNDKIVLYYADDHTVDYPDGASVIKLNYTTLPLQVKQSTTGVKIKSSTVDGDTIKSAKSSKPSVASVKVSKGKMTITGKKAGTARITVTSAKKGTATVTIKVQKKKVAITSMSVSGSDYSIKRKAKKQITIKKKPITAQETLTWRSKNKKIATVDQKGVVTGIKAGRTTIIAESPSGLKVSVVVSVYK